MKITLEGTSLTVTLNYKFPVHGFHEKLQCNFANDFQAQIRASNIIEAFEELVTEVRREEYNKGWKDAKSHKAIKKTWFFHILEKGKA